MKRGVCQESTGKGWILGIYLGLLGMWEDGIQIPFRYFARVGIYLNRMGLELVEV